jgi:GxxExxY protein
MELKTYETGNIQGRGAAFEIYNSLRCGPAEDIYQECLEIELEVRRLSFSSKVELRCFYKA